MSAILRTKVRHLLFDGYSDALLEAASNFYPSQVSQSKFGWFYGRNNTSNDGLYRIFTGQSDKGLKFGLLDTWNGEKSLGKWPPGDTCRSLERTSASDFQPPFFLASNRHFLDYLSKDRVQMPEPSMRIFLGDLCRAFDLQLKEEEPISYGGLLGYRYRADANVFNYSLPENKCFCQHGCVPLDYRQVFQLDNGNKLYFFLADVHRAVSTIWAFVPKDLPSLCHFHIFCTPTLVYVTK